LATTMTRKNINIRNNNVRVLLQQQNHFNNNNKDPYKRTTMKQHKEKSTSTSNSTTISNTKTKKKKTYTVRPLHRSSFNQSPPSPSSSPRSHDAVHKISLVEKYTQPNNIIKFN
jgi:hypothetical protein